MPTVNSSVTVDMPPGGWLSTTSRTGEVVTVVHDPDLNKIIVNFGRMSMIALTPHQWQLLMDAVAEVMPMAVTP